MECVSVVSTRCLAIYEVVVSGCSAVDQEKKEQKMLAGGNSEMDSDQNEQQNLSANEHIDGIDVKGKGVVGYESPSEVNLELELMHKHEPVIDFNVMLAHQEIQGPSTPAVNNEGNHVVVAEEKKEIEVIPEASKLIPCIELTPSLRTRIRWTPELHARFLYAVQELGGPHFATPKTVTKIMGVNGLTLKHVKSHLQKYRQGRFTMKEWPEPISNAVSYSPPMEGQSVSTALGYLPPTANRCKVKRSRKSRKEDKGTQAQKHLKLYHEACPEYLKDAMANPNKEFGNPYIGDEQAEVGGFYVPLGPGTGSIGTMETMSLFLYDQQNSNPTYNVTDAVEMHANVRKQQCGYQAQNTAVATPEQQCGYQPQDVANLVTTEREQSVFQTPDAAYSASQALQYRADSTTQGLQQGNAAGSSQEGFPSPAGEGQQSFLQTVDKEDPVDASFFWHDEEQQTLNIGFDWNDLAEFPEHLMKEQDHSYCLDVVDHDSVTGTDVGYL